MKARTDSIFREISKEQLENLTMEVKETLACESHHGYSKIFSVVDLWKIQRNGKNKVQRNKIV